MKTKERASFAKTFITAKQIPLAALPAQVQWV
jgi:hypothetical protein